MAASLRPHVLFIASWLVTILLCAFFLRLACGLLIADRIHDEFLTELRLSDVAGPAAGVVASYFVDRFVRWRQEKKAAME